MTLALLRCDATLEGGVGHLVRALAVARAARDAGWQVELCGDVESPLGRSLVAEVGVELVPADTAELAVLAAARGAAVVHLDDYDVPVGARDDVARADVILSSMEDGVFGRRPADVVIDSTIGAEDVPRPDDGSPVVLRGIHYAPMRPDVLRASSWSWAARTRSVPQRWWPRPVLGPRESAS
jgi:spore coat polysaccharide biosynthesis predicted glycosyltransferase SpsG